MPDYRTCRNDYTYNAVMIEGAADDDDKDGAGGGSGSGSDDEDGKKGGVREETPIPNPVVQKGLQQQGKSGSQQQRTPISAIKQARMAELDARMGGGKSAQQQVNIGSPAM
jgi:hypothetical protein